MMFVEAETTPARRQVGAGRGFAALGGLAAAVLWSAAAQAAEVPQTLGASLVSGYIQPATQRFSQAGQDMAKTLQAYCAGHEAGATGAVPAQAVKAGFNELVRSWAGVEFLRFGPLVEDNRFERIFFWPDPRGTVQRRTQAVLAKADVALLQAGALRADSVAIQGLPSLEYALFGGNEALLGDAAKPGGPGAGYRCAYATAVAVNVAGLAGEIAQAWGPQGQMAQHFQQPGPNNPLYRSPAEVAAETIKAMSSGLHYIRDAKLLAALGASPEKAKPASSPLWRSGETLDAVAAGVSGIGEFYRAADLAPVFDKNNQWLAVTVTNSAQRIAGRLKPLTMPFDVALAQPEPRATLVATVVELSELKEMIDGQIANALGVNVGFNALDGD